MGVDLTVGLTGGIASGKSLVADMFVQLGVPVVDTDVVARQVVEPGSDGLAAVREAFGNEVIDDHGVLDRRHMRTLIFASPTRRRQLEAILHPLIRAETLGQLAAIHGPYGLVVVPLLAETGFAQLVDRVLVVDCPPELQIKQRFATLYRDLPFSAQPDGVHRYHFVNPTYSYADAIFLHCMLRMLQPRRLIEVGFEGGVHVVERFPFLVA